MRPILYPDLGDRSPYSLRLFGHMRWGNARDINWRWDNGVSLRPIVP